MTASRRRFMLKQILIVLGLLYPLVYWYYVKQNTDDGDINIGKFFSNKVTWIVMLCFAAIFAWDPSLIGIEINDP